jgi:cell division protein FtsL
MGLETLPNGMQYFNLSEELAVWTKALYTSLTPMNIGILAILLVIFVAMVIIWALYNTRKMIEEPINE